jgi:NAD(P)-dependent dehydrogenase (short-subunit alcohol dehydrogenase family)|tara:strand:+ start:11900 stop:12643 length:744 start_codon:yes stop_codon:yes gene_type:complete
MNILNNKIAIITGGGTGIGKSIAKIFCKEGAKVIIASRNQENLINTINDIRQTGNEIIDYIKCDITNTDEVRDLFSQTFNKYGSIDILVNNSGVIEGDPIDQVSDEKWENVIAVNVTGTFKCTRESFKYMKQNGGKIINIGSIAGETPRMHSSPYTTSKHAIRGLTKSAALDGREYGIAVGCLNPGNTMVERRPDGRSASGLDEGQEILINSEDIARTALLMASMPASTNAFEATVLPIKQPFIGRG